MKIDMMKFVYVMDLESKEVLEKRGYRLLKADEKHGVFCFENKDGMEFAMDIPCVFSNVMTF